MLILVLALCSLLSLYYSDNIEDIERTSTVSAETAQKQIEAVLKGNGTCNKFGDNIRPFKDK
jgi:hypothetical protein